MVTSGIKADTAGAGFKPRHGAEIFADLPDVGFFEVHAENYMGAGGPPHAQLERLAADYAMSVHGVGLSIGGAGDLDTAHLVRLKRVLDRYQPALFSEHLAWSTHQAGYFNDLLALPYTTETLNIVAAHIDQVQSFVGRRMALENPATYIRFSESTWDEVDFLAELQRRTGCVLLLDVNNVYVSAVNHGRDAADYIARFPMQHVEEIHLAGHAETQDDDGKRLLIDAHDSAVSYPVLALYQRIIARCGHIPTLIEWDNDVPAWSVLRREIEKITAALRANTDAECFSDVA